MDSYKPISPHRKTPSVTFSLTVVQCIACAIILLLALVFRLVGGSFFDTLASFFKQAITDTAVTQTTAECFSSAVGGTNLSIKGPNVTELPKMVSAEPIVVKGKAMLPLSAGKITSSFGRRTDPFTNEVGFHTGVDIGAPEGTAIMAVYDGTVVRADKNSSYGNYLLIQHNNGFQTLYAHCSTLCKKVGDVVVAGEMVAKVGNTGKSTGNHLHLELRKNDIYYNPVEILEDNPYA